MKWTRKDSWGTWHTGPAAPGPCPQDGYFHDVQEAASLNANEREYKQAVLYESMRRWREK
jgi:hypothetical protein